MHNRIYPHPDSVGSSAEVVLQRMLHEVGSVSQSEEGTWPDSVQSGGSTLLKNLSRISRSWSFQNRVNNVVSVETFSKLQKDDQTTNWPHTKG